MVVPIENTCSRVTSPTSSSSPTGMKLSKSFMAALPGLYSCQLKFVSIIKNIVNEIDDSMTFRSVAVEEISTNRADASVVFVVRRPGCVLCREHGQQLMELAKKFHERGMSVAMWGVIKEVAVDDVGLSEFYNDHFKYPLYKDVNLSLYEAFGNRKIGLSTWNPIRLYQSYKMLNARLNQKNLTGNLKGEGFTQGGILILDKTGDVKFAFEEDIGSELAVHDIMTGVNEVLEKRSMNTHSTPEGIEMKQ